MSKSIHKESGKSLYYIVSYYIIAVIRVNVCDKINNSAFSIKQHSLLIIIN